jgi:hypothetical protein
MNQLPVNHRLEISSFVDEIRCDEQVIRALAFATLKNDAGVFFPVWMRGVIAGWCWNFLSARFSICVSEKMPTSLVSTLTVTSNFASWK